MKPSLPLYCLLALICLQSCGDSVKNKTADAEQKHSASSKIPVPNANNNLVINNTDDLIGYWVGMFKADTNVVKKFSGDRTNYETKINISIDAITGDNVNGHTILGGVFKPFSGTVKKDGAAFRFYIQQPGSDKNDGTFKFNITIGDTLLSGTWAAANKVNVSARMYGLTKKIFRYNQATDIESARFMDWTKTIPQTYVDEDGKSVRNDE